MLFDESVPGRGLEAIFLGEAGVIGQRIKAEGCLGAMLGRGALKRIGPESMLNFLGDSHRCAVLQPPCYRDVRVSTALLSTLNYLVAPGRSFVVLLSVFFGKTEQNCHAAPQPS